ncbi:hypothetical protein SNOG_04114 [Parastagonospora nodorum SN15]|uniref:Uncharacterized protein n=1 Tax=Phaeosphaeria nodorum (strain SN15 / ATCC MYA-4574 / FGSC 10173) TaxID=321614 RepID=Q0UVV0_PHANO|nr:hypothetical protein SNOG_04114 [Parastagonospora nodorum SN15]EAT87874.1 hypothetical protein SNOG_04114 [Parastagonospora nodorum SN15]
MAQELGGTGITALHFTMNVEKVKVKAKRKTVVTKHGARLQIPCMKPLHGLLFNRQQQQPPTD